MSVWTHSSLKLPSHRWFSAPPRPPQKCEAAGLKKTGTKDELVARVREHEGPLPEEEDKEGDDAEDGGKGKKTKKEKASPAKKVTHNPLRS
jgi:hypothetical protein